MQSATACLAAEGLGGLSLRSVAQRAGGSLGSLSYHVGSKASLIEQLLVRQLAERAAVFTEWRDRLAGIDLSVAGVLAKVVETFLDEMALRRREASLAGCELLIGASHAPDEFRGIATLLDQEETFWHQLLTPDFGDVAAPFARVLAGYARDELPFSIVLAGTSDYRLLRAATIARIARGLAGRPEGLARHFDRLVAACGTASAGEVLPVDLPPGSKKAELAGHVARLIAEQGMAAVTHRAVAARAGVPNSSVAHHFRTREDLLYAGIGASVVAMRGARDMAGWWTGDDVNGTALIRATHASALQAARDAAITPLALDMRRRRAENFRAVIGKELGIDDREDGAGIQAAAIAFIGAAFGELARGGIGAGLRIADLAALRTTMGTGRE